MLIRCNDKKTNQYSLLAFKVLVYAGSYDSAVTPATPISRA